MAAGLPVDREGLIDVAFAAMRSEPWPRSRTDIPRAYDAITRFGHMTEWTSPELVERLRMGHHERLLRALRGPRALGWLRDLVAVPEAAQWLCGQMQTPAERAVLRALLLALRTPKPGKS